MSQLVDLDTTALLPKPEQPLGLSRDSAHNYFWRDEWGITEKLPSVTKVVGLMEKPALVPAASRIVAGYCASHLEDLARLVLAVGIPEATKKLANMPRAEWDAKADLGSRVHTLAEAVLRGREVLPLPDELPYIEGLWRFISQAHPIPLALEEMVAFEDEAGLAYAGTLDAVLAINGERWLVDFKTGKDLWPETALQLAGYAFATFVGRPGELTRYALPDIDRFAVLHLRPELPDGFALVPYQVTQAEWRAFMALLDAWVWARAPKAKRERLRL